MENSNDLSERNIRPFNGEKYNEWEFRIRAFLSEVDVTKVIDDIEPAVKTLVDERQAKAKGIKVE